MRWIFAEFGEDARKFSYRAACAYEIAQRTPASNILRISDRIIFFFSSSFLSQNVVGFRGFRSLRSFRSSKPTSYPGLPSLPVPGLPACGVSGLPACGVPIIS